MPPTQNDEFHELRKLLTDHLEIEGTQQLALYNAVFQQEDKARNIPAGLLQQNARIAEQLREIQIWQDRQKTFIGGVTFAVTSVGFLLSSFGSDILHWLKGSP